MKTTNNLYVAALLTLLALLSSPLQAATRFDSFHSAVDAKEKAETDPKRQKILKKLLLYTVISKGQADDCKTIVKIKKELAKLKPPDSELGMLIDAVASGLQSDIYGLEVDEFNRIHGLPSGNDQSKLVKLHIAATDKYNIVVAIADLIKRFTAFVAVSNAFANIDKQIQAVIAKMPAPVMFEIPGLKFHSTPSVSSCTASGGSSTISISSTQVSGDMTVSIDFFSSSPNSTPPIAFSPVSGELYVSKGNTINSYLPGSDFKVTITNVVANGGVVTHFTGTFSGTFVNPTNSKDTVKVTKGVLDADTK